VGLTGPGASFMNSFYNPYPAEPAVSRHMWPARQL
jgi:hypothetical protein